MQLQATLDSIEIYTRELFKNIDVVYLANNSKYRYGYRLLEERKPYVNFIEETNFEEDIKSCFKMDYTCLAADDDLVFRKFDKKLFRVFDDPNVVCFSLRLGLNIDYCYSEDKSNKINSYKKDGEFIHWSWRNEELDFAYPLSVVSSIFRTDFIKGLTDRISFRDTNTYEASLQALITECPPKMYAYKESKMFGVPANSVNASWTNRNGLEHGYSTSELADMYLEGKIIVIAGVRAEDIHSAQQEIQYKFKQYGQ